MQLGFALYIRNTLAACAQDGARYAANENIVTQGDGAMIDAASQQAVTCVKESMPDSFGGSVSATVPDVADSAGVPVLVVEVRISAPFPLVGLFGLGPQVIHAQGDAMQERP